jgi:hypothetical protein
MTDNDDQSQEDSHEMFESISRDWLSEVQKKWGPVMDLFCVSSIKASKPEDLEEESG